MVKKLVSRQVVWAAEMFNKAYPVKSFPVEINGIIRKVLHLRGCHYWIVSQPEAERQIPGVGGRLRSYENTHKEFQNLSDLLVRARIEGLVDPDKFLDKRNAPIVRGGKKEIFKIESHYISASTGNYFSATVDAAKDWASFVNNVDIDPQIQKARFHSQMYEVVVITEKATVEAVIKDICKQYGANCLAVTGQSSVTRVYDAVNIAKANKRPILLLGLYDLDPAGHDMGPSFMKRIQDIYPDSNHRFVRVCLMREQADKLSLPIAFDTNAKEYPQKQRDRFLAETGGIECIELDALDNSFIRSELRKALDKYMGNNADKFRNRRLVRKEENRVTDILEAFDFELFEDDYNAALETYTKFQERAQRLIKVMGEHYYKVSGDLDAIEKEISDALSHEVSLR